MKENKNIVIMAWRDMWHPGVGGAEIYISKMVESLQKEGYNIKYLTARYRNSKAKEVIDGVEYIRMGNSISIYLLLPLYYIFRLKKDTSVLIENFNAVPFNIPIYNRNNITVIHHLQDTEWISAYGKFVGSVAAKVFTKMTSLVYRKQRKVVTVSPSSKTDLISKGFKGENITIVYNGIETSVVESINKDQKNINIVSIGRIKPTKYINEAIEMIEYTVRELKKENIKLYIAGKGEDEERLKKIVESKNLQHYVEFLGFISDEEKEVLLEKAHLHVQFSRKEGWGITVIEAASKGTPTICYPVSGLIDSVSDDTGYFIKTDLKETWKHVINSISSNSQEYTQKQIKCIEWAKLFKWEHQCLLFLEEVEDILSSSIGIDATKTTEIKKSIVK